MNKSKKSRQCTACGSKGYARCTTCGKMYCIDCFGLNEEFLVPTCDFCKGLVKYDYERYQND